MCGPVRSQVGVPPVTLAALPLLAGGTRIIAGNTVIGVAVVITAAAAAVVLGRRRLEHSRVLCMVTLDSVLLLRI